MEYTHVPVLIVGAGAAGLTASASLAQQGVPSLLVEKRRERFVYPKARNLSFRSLEILRRLGLADQIHAIADGVADMVVKSALNSSDERPAIDLDAVFAGMDDLSPEPVVQYCPQSLLEPILLADTRAKGSQVRYGTELCSFEQDEAGVTAVLRDASGETETIRADYLVAADGTRSPVREALGIPTTGYGPLPLHVVFIYFRGPWRKLVPHLADGDSVQVVNDLVSGIFVGAEGDLGMFITSYRPSQGESAAQFTDERGLELLRAAVGEPLDLELIEIGAWQPYEQVAEQFQCGRVFLVGDAAHTMPPLKAGGANCAIQSADNLAWKLAAVLGGHAGLGLLETFHAERHPVGTFSAHQSLTGPTVALLRADGEAPTPEEEKPMFAILTGYQYVSRAVEFGNDEPREAAVHLVDELRAQPGTRVPHVWLGRGGDEVSTLDLLGPGFTVLARGSGAQWNPAAADVSAALGIPLQVVDVDEFDVDGRWAQASGLASGAAVLVRPDEFVGWRAEEAPSDGGAALRQALSRILDR